MIGVRTPFRVSFAGGGTDIPNFYREHGGMVISTSINKYMYHFIHKFSEEEIQIKYSITENLTNVKQIKHPIVREASKIFDIKGLDINSIADIPKGSGLGSSSAYTVGLLHGLSLLNNKKISKSELAEAASDLEINKLGDPIGKQDHYASSYGGLNIFSFEKDDSVKVKKINLDEKSLKFLSSSMTLIKYGKSRKASTILSDQAKNLESNKNLSQTVEIFNLVSPMVQAIKSLDIKKMGEILSENWHYKKQLSNLITSKDLEAELKSLTSNKNIYGGKLLGAGGNGYILVIGDPKEIKKISGRSVVNFDFEKYGSKKIYSDE